MLIKGKYSRELLLTGFCVDGATFVGSRAILLRLLERGRDERERGREGERERGREGERERGREGERERGREKLIKREERNEIKEWKRTLRWTRNQKRDRWCDTTPSGLVTHTPVDGLVPVQVAASHMVYPVLADVSDDGAMPANDMFADVEAVAVVRVRLPHLPLREVAQVIVKSCNEMTARYVRI